MQWAGMTMEAVQEAAAGASLTEAAGQAGAEWCSLKVHSCRTAQFSEQELWFRFGYVTHDNTLVKGQDPQTAPWVSP